MHRAAVIVFLFAGCVGGALAHPNHAGGSPLGAGLLHLLTEPDHLATLVLPLVVAVAIVVGLRRRRSRRARRDHQSAPARRRRGRSLR
jgi:hydrogenase/urease accessory protein HupE